MIDTVLVPNAQDAVLGSRCLIAVIDKNTGRQVVGLMHTWLNAPYTELRCAGLGYGWHDNTGREWRQVDGRWVAC
jgi:hypothetical protein